MTASDGNCSAGSCRICKAIEMKVAQRTKAWWQSRWQRWWHRCHLQLPLVVEEDEQAFAFLSVHSSTLPEHWAVHTTGKPHWKAKKCTAACKPTGKHSGEHTEEQPNQVCKPQCYSRCWSVVKMGDSFVLHQKCFFFQHLFWKDTQKCFAVYTNGQ